MGGARQILAVVAVAAVAATGCTSTEGQADDATAETQQLIQRLWSDLDRAGQRTLCDLAEQRDIDDFFTEDPLPSGQMPDTAEIYRFLRDRCE